MKVGLVHIGSTEVQTRAREVPTAGMVVMVGTVGSGGQIGVQVQSCT